MDLLSPDTYCLYCRPRTSCSRETFVCRVDPPSSGEFPLEFSRRIKTKMISLLIFDRLHFNRTLPFMESAHVHGSEKVLSVESSVQSRLWGKNALGQHARFSSCAPPNARRLSLPVFLPPPCIRSTFTCPDIMHKQALFSSSPWH